MKITRAIRVSHLGDDKLMTTLLGEMLTVTIDQSEGISGADIPEQAVKKMRIQYSIHTILRTKF